MTNPNFKKNNQNFFDLIKYTLSTHLKEYSLSTHLKEYSLFLIIFMFNFIFLVNEYILEWQLLDGFQTINYDYLKDNTLKSIYYFHIQPPIFHLIMAFLYKIANQLENILIFEEIFQYTKQHPTTVQAATTLWLILQILIVPIQGIYFKSFLNLFFSSKTSIIIAILYILSPYPIYLILLGSWEFLFSFLLLALLFNIFKIENCNKQNLLIISGLIIFLALLRSTFKFPIIIIIFSYFLINFKTSRKEIFKFLILPVTLILIIFSLKNYKVSGKFSLETQSIYHMAQTWGPYLIKDPQYYNQLDDLDKSVFKHFQLGLLHGGAGFLEALGYKKDSKNKYLKGNNHLVFTEASDAHHKLFFRTLANKEMWEILHYFNYSFNRYWGDNFSEGQKIIGNIRSWNFYQFFRSEKNIFGNLIASLLLSSLILSTLNFSNIVNFNEKEVLFNRKFLFFSIFVSYFLSITGLIVVGGNSRYSVTCEPVFILYLLISFLWIKKNFQSFSKFSKIFLIFAVVLVFSRNIIFQEVNKINNFKNFEKVNLQQEQNLDKKNTGERKFPIEFIKIPSNKYTIANDATYYFSLKHERYLKEFYISEQEIPFSLYLEFMDSDIKNNYCPTWWDKKLSTNENIIKYKKIYNVDINERNLDKYPIAGISYEDAKKFTEWFSIKYDVKADLPYDYEWDVAANYVEKNKKTKVNKKNFDYRGKFAQLNQGDEFVGLINFEKKDEYSKFYGNLWEWTKVPKNLLYSVNKRSEFSTTLPDNFDVKLEQYSFERDFYIRKSDEYAFLRGGSFMTFDKTVDLKSSKLILGKKIKDIDFGFRIVVRNN